MSGTARTIATLYANTPDNTSGLVAPVTMRDVETTMAIRTGYTYGTCVRVTDPEFGADPTGATDSTTAFQNAMAAGPALVPAFRSDGVTPALYRVQNCVVPNGAALIGETVPVYAGGGGAYKGFGSTSGGFYVPAIIAPLSSSTTRLFNVNGKSGITFRALVLDCSDVSGFSQGAASQVCDGISGGGQNLNLDSVSIYYAKSGLGGATGAGGPTFPNGTWIAQIRSCNFMNCVRGLNDVIDVHLSDCWFTGCQNGILPTSGVSASTFVNTRFEWCGLVGSTSINWASGGYGISAVGGLTSCQFIGCYFDTNGLGGANLDGAFQVSFTGCYWQENGCNVVSGTTLPTTSAHVRFNLSFNILFTGNQSRGDQSTGVNASTLFAPAHWANFVGGAGNNGAIAFVGNDLSGYQGGTAGGVKTAPQSSNTTWFTGALPTASGVNSFILKNNLGTGTAAQDVDTR